jgi:hypothetical protein
VRVMMKEREREEEVVVEDLEFTKGLTQDE